MAKLREEHEQQQQQYASRHNLLLEIKTILACRSYVPCYEFGKYTLLSDTVLLPASRALTNVQLTDAVQQWRPGPTCSTKTPLSGERALP